MRIGAVCACTMGVAHTFIAKDKLVEAGERLNHYIKVETQGNIGAESVLTTDDLSNMDVVIIAADININGMERFKNIPVVKVPITTAIKQPEQLIKKIELKLEEEKRSGK